MKSGQKTISSYFVSSPEAKTSKKSGPKRTKSEARSAAPSAPHAVVDLTSDNDEEQPVRKKPRKKAEPTKKTDIPFFLLDPAGPFKTNKAQPVAGPSRSPPTNGGVQKYKYNVLSVEERDKVASETETTEGNEAKMDRRLAFRKRLLEDNSIFSTTAAGRGFAPGKRKNNDTSPMDVDKTYPPRRGSHDESEASASEEEARLPSTITAKAFETLTNTIINEKAKGKKNEAVGPSGEPYTPLEKQVREFVALNIMLAERLEGQRTEGTLP